MQHLTLEEAAPFSPQQNCLDIGQVFLQARQEQRLELSEVAKNLYIRQIYLEAIEQGNFDVLPGRVYTLGFMKKYAEFLKLDFQELHRRLDLRDDNTTLILDDVMQPYTSARYKRYVWLSFVLVAVVGGGYTYMRFSASPDSVDRIIEAPILESNPVDAPEPVTDAIENNNQEENQLIAPVIESDKPTQLVPQPVTLVLRATQSVWVDVRDATGQPILKRVLQTGEQYTLPQQKGLMMTVGNAGGLEILKNESRLPSLGAPGKVRKGISIDSLFSTD